MNKKLEEFNQRLKTSKIAVIGVGVSNLPLLDYLDNLNCDVTISEREPIHLLSKHHLNKIYCIAILKNKRLVSGGFDSKIIVYDKNYTKPDLEIKEHSGAVTSLVVSSNGNLISSSCDKTLKIFKIEENVKNDKISLSYYLIQNINTNHGNNIIHVRELSSNKLVSCSLDTKLNFYLSQILCYRKKLLRF